MYLLHSLLHVALLLHHRLVYRHWAWRGSRVGLGWHALPWRGHHVAGLLRRRRRSLEHHGGRIHGSVRITGLAWRLSRQAHVAELGAQVILLAHTRTQTGKKRGQHFFFTFIPPYVYPLLSFSSSFYKQATGSVKWLREIFCPVMRCEQKAGFPNGI